MASAGAAAITGLLPACSSRRVTGTSASGTPYVRPTDVVEIVQSSWEVRPGLIVPMRTYGGAVPGKVLRYKSGERAVIRVVNRTTEAQTVHWHGLVVAETVDGVPELGTPKVLPGQSRDYEFVVQPAGTRWYHSHLFEGLFSGMYGPFIIEDPNERADYDREVILMLGAFDARIPTSSSMTDERPAGSPGLTKPVMSMGAMSNMNGMQGMPGMSGMNTSGMPHGGSMDSMNGPNMGMRDALYAAYGVNGRALNVSDPVRVKRGERVLFRIINANPTKTFRIALPAHRFEVTHFDGYPVGRRRSIDALELGVAERIDAIVTMNQPGVWILGSTVADERQRGLGIVIAYDGTHGAPQWRDGANDAFHYTDFGKAGTEPQIERGFDLTLRKSPASRDAWSINGKSYPHTDPIDVAEGRSYLLRFRNMSMMEHPMHLHGHGFEIANVDGVLTSGVVKDTVTVRPRGGRVDVLLRANNPYRGRFLLHCHNEQHMQGGMASVLRYT